MFGMSSPSILPLLLLLAVASAGPLELPDGEAASTLMPPSIAAAAAAVPTAPSVSLEEHAIPAATIAPQTDGQYCTVAGTVFHNGERLPPSADPDPCRACYCQAGESVCTRVHCYRRPDCAPRHVPGSCCPKYDNCPPVPEERAPEPRVKDASTQTDLSADPSTSTPDATTEASNTTVSTTQMTTTETTSEHGATDLTESTETAGTATATATTDVTAATATTTMVTTTTATLDTFSEATSEDDDEEEEVAATNPYPPGINLQALHEHLQFLSPGDANGPNT